MQLQGAGSACYRLGVGQRRRPQPAKREGAITAHVIATAVSSVLSARG